MEFRANIGIEELKLTSVSFPTDRVTVGALRAAFPSDFDFDWHPRENHKLRFLDTLMSAVFHEREYAARAYLSATNRKPPQLAIMLDQEELIDMLLDDYVKLGIASGPAQAKELLRDVERQVLAQAPTPPAH